MTRIKSVMTSGQSGGGGHRPVKWIFAVLGGIAVAGVAVALAGTGAGPALVIGVGALGVAGVAALFAPQQSLQIAGVAALVVVLVGSAGLFAGVLKYGDEDISPGPALASPPPTTPAEVAAVTSGPVRSGEGWYDLTLHQPVESAEGQEIVPSITIGVGRDPFPNSIRGFQTSSAGQPRNSSTWATAGRCTRLSVWVGKDAASSESAGAGQFVVKADDQEITTRQASVSDAPQHLEVDISTVGRLTLLDVRANKDADNAWGTPRAYCTAPPGKSRS
ncbi:NPCBM/NEW2 domain-containing protein [Lentzea sp. NPDC060358]|uniref:NPCBM/NEW2 domain-containing protein n=1 Tax=Lentzea sp. NPDC060358 TaxID=3347103 RepID=UPI00365FEC34